MSGPNLTVLLGGRDVTTTHKGLQFSSVDTGGLEAAQLTPGRLGAAGVGDRLEVFCGLDRVWMGDVLDPGDLSRPRQSSGQVSAVGPGQALKTNAYPYSYLAAQLSAWKDRRAETTTPLGSGLVCAAGQVSSDGGLMLGFPKDYAAALSDTAGVLLDMGPNTSARQLVFSGTSSNNNNTTPQLVVHMYAWSDASGVGATSVYGPQALTTIGASFTDQVVSIGNYRYLFICLEVSVAGTLAADGWIKFTEIRAMPETRFEASGASDLRPDDVVRDALDRSTAAILPGRIDRSNLTIPHLAFPYEPRTPETWMLDMQKLTGWHLGTWQPPTVLDETPRLHFHPPPPVATCAVRWQDCPEGDAPRARLDQLYNQCQCTYTAADGTPGTVTVARDTPFLSAPRTLQVAMGTGDAASAALYAKLALSFAQSSQRGGGWATLPPVVQTPGGPRWSCTLMAGRDRIRLIGLPEVGPILAPDTRSYDTFLLRRVETTVDERGAARTRVEFDGGGDLMEVLNARMAAAMGAAGL